MQSSLFQTHSREQFPQLVDTHASHLQVPDPGKPCSPQQSTELKASCTSSGWTTVHRTQELPDPSKRGDTKPHLSNRLRLGHPGCKPVTLMILPHPWLPMPLAPSPKRYAELLMSSTELPQ